MFRLNTVWSFKYIIRQIYLQAIQFALRKNLQKICKVETFSCRGELTLTKCSASTAAAQIPFDSLWKYFVRGQLHPCPKETAVGKRLHIWRSDSICVKSTFRITTLRVLYMDDTVYIVHKLQMFKSNFPSCLKCMIPFKTYIIANVYRRMNRHIYGCMVDDYHNFLFSLFILT